MDHKKIKECLDNIKKEVATIEELMGDGGKKEYTSLDQVREKANEPDKEESQAV